MRPLQWFFTGLVLSMLILHATAPAGFALKVRGYVKPLLVVTDYGSAGLDTDSPGARTGKKEVSASTAMRITVFSSLGDDASAEAAFEIRPYMGNAESSSSSFVPGGADPLSYRAVDTGEAIVSRDGSDLKIYQNIDRLFLTVTVGPADIYAGRQPVAFGSARVINPTDIFTAFSFSEINTEDRSGVDAVRVRASVGALSEIDGGIVAGDGLRADESAAYIRGRFPVGPADISPTAALFRQNLMLGIDLASSVSDAGYWIEAASVFVDSVGDRKPEEDYLRLSAGIDYNFSGNFYSYVEYHYNGAGVSDADDYIDIISGRVNGSAYTEGGVYLLGRHYLAPGFRYELTPLATLSGRALINLGDGSSLLAPQLSYSLSDNTVMEIGAFISSGNEGEFVRLPGGPPVLGRTVSEFGLYPDRYYFTIRQYL